MLVVDIAVPRNVEDSVGELDDIYLYTVDDLSDVIEDNRRSRREAADKTEKLVEGRVAELMGWLGTRNVSGLIREYRGLAEDTRNEVLKRALGMLGTGNDPAQTLRFLANTLTNKLIHVPTNELRRACAEGRLEAIEQAQVFLGIEGEKLSEAPLAPDTKDGQ